MGRIDRGVNCSIVGCGNGAVRSMSLVEVSKAISNLGLSLGSNAPRRVYLCEVHYKAVKKFLKKERMYDRWRLG
ncbi:MAG: hypothetical protein QXI93_01885 [Candidatus Methanomethylicia archaeon]